MKISSSSFPRRGDAINSTFFEDYLLRLLEERDTVGVTDIIQEVDALMLTADPGHAVAYVIELALMTPYQYLATLESKHHWTHILRINTQTPDFLIREVKNKSTRGIFRSLNEVYPIGAKKPNSRYMGEIIRVTDIQSVVDHQSQREFRFFSPNERSKLELPGNLAVSKPSPYTHNIVAYLQREMDQVRVYDLGESKVHAPIADACLAAKQRQQELGIEHLLQPIDHLATRVYAQNRELALLEWLSWSSYYYWGSYSINAQNSSTNVTKSVHHKTTSRSPAKVFTANNTPYFVTHLDKMPSPTETFVRNYGPRLHHIAFSIADGQTLGLENIDYVVEQLKSEGIRFLLDVVGSRAEGLRQVFSCASPHSSLIVEYVQRFNNFQGFFAKNNVGELTFAAGQEEELTELQASILEITQSRIDH